MMEREFEGNERIYLLGAVGCMLKSELIDRDREIYEHLRDRLAAGHDFAPDIRAELGLDDPLAPRRQHQ